MRANMDFKPMTKNKVSLDIMHQVRRAILKGDFKPGDALPSEKQMTAQFKVSKHTMREALRGLEAMGLVEIRKGAGGGPVVREINQDILNSQLTNFFSFKEVSIHDLTEVRLLLEPHLAGRAAETMPPEKVLGLHRLNDKCQSILDQGRSIIGGEEEIAFHSAIADASGNVVVETLLRFVNCYLAELKLARKPGIDFSRRVLKSHREIAEAIGKGDGALAAARMRDHLLEVEQSLPATTPDRAG